MKKIILTSLLALFLFSFGQAQDYNTGIGLRGGFYNGLTLKHFISSNRALEGLISSRWRGLELTGLYEIHHRAFQVDRLNWYYGLGAHAGFYNGDYTYKYSPHPWGEPGNSYTVIGVDFILGLEYSFTELPINIGIDWKPVYNFTGYSRFWADGGAFSIRYIF